MKPAYQLKLKQHKRRLGLTHKELNKLTRKHTHGNLLKHLQSLNPTSPPVGDTGFYGTFLIDNETAYLSVGRYMIVTLGYNDIVIDGPYQINGDSEVTLTIPIEDRAPLPSSTIQLKVTFQSDTAENVDIQGATGFTITGFTNNSLQEENTLSMLIDSESINNGACSMVFIVSS